MVSSFSSVVALFPVVGACSPVGPASLGALLRAKLDELNALHAARRVAIPGYSTARVVGVYHNGEEYCFLGVGIQGEEMWTEEEANNYFFG